MDPANETTLLDWHWAARPIDGEQAPGDLHLVKSFPRGVLVAVMDGVGHGEEAIVAARCATDILMRDPGASVIVLIQRCHEALKQTRGVVMTVASFDSVDQTITWLGVGNVEARLLRCSSDPSHSSEHALLRGGLVGLNLPPLHASVVPVAPGDLLVLATDGIRAEFDQSIDSREPARVIADNILKRHFKGTDDALVLAARYLGGK